MNHIRSSFTLFIFSIVVAGVLFSASLAHSQPFRALGAGALVLDDGNGNTITLIPPPGLVGNYNYYLPKSPGGNIMSGYVAAGSALGQVLYWNGTYWQPGGVGSDGQVLTLNGSGIPIWAPAGEGGGSFINNSTSLQTSASFNIDGSGQVGTTFNISATNGAYHIGGNAVLADDHSHFNLFIGDGAGASNTSGSDNTYTGEGAGNSNTNGSSNSFFGTLSGANNTGGGGLAGSFNSFFGRDAGSTNSTGNNITLIGSGTDVGADGLTDATALGAGAVVAASHTIQLGDGNVTSVNSNGSFNTTGGGFETNGDTVIDKLGNGTFTSVNSEDYLINGVAMISAPGTNFDCGPFACPNIGPFSGITNGTFLGNSAGYKTLEGIDNTFVGGAAGYSFSYGDNNTVLGADADFGSINLSNAMALGANAVVRASNTIQLGDGNVTTVNAHGSFNTAAGGFQTNGTTRIDANGSATLDSLTASSVVTFTGLAAGIPTNYLALDASNNVILASGGGGGGGISGSGTAGRIPIWTDTTTQGNSHLADNGTTLSYLGSDINTGSDYKINNTTVLSTYTIDGADELFLGHGAGGSDDLTDATAIGANAIVQADFTIQLGDANVTSINTYGALTAAGLTINNVSGNNDVTGSSWSVDNGGNGIFNTLALNNAGNSNDITGTNYNWYADNTGFLLAGNGIESDNGLDVYGDGVYVDQNGIYVNGGVEVGTDNVQVDEGDVNIQSGNLYVGSGFEADNDGTTTINEGSTSDALTINGGEGNDITGTNDNWQVDGSGNASFSSLAINTPISTDNGGTNSLPDAQIIIGTGGTPNYEALAGDATMDDIGNVTVQSYNGGYPFANMASQDESSVDITGGSIDGTSVGFNNPQYGAFSTLSAGTGGVFNVDASGNTSTNGTLSSNGAINSVNADLETNSVTRIDNTGNFTVGGNLFITTESDAASGDQVTVSGNNVFTEVTGSGSGPVTVIVTNASNGQMLYLYDHVVGMTLSLNGFSVAEGKMGVFVFYAGNWIGTN